MSRLELQLLQIKQVSQVPYMFIQAFHFVTGRSIVAEHGAQKRTNLMTFFSLISMQ